MVITFFDPTNQEGGATGGTVSGITLWSDEYTKEYINDVISEELSGYTKTIDFATINGSAITEGGNLIIEGGGGGATGGTISGITLWSDETTEEYVDCRLSSYTQTVDFATINGSAITEGGNLIIEGGSGGTTYSAGTNIDITNNVISVTGITDSIGSLQGEVNDLWEETESIRDSMGYLEQEVYDASPVDVLYTDWEYDEDDNPQVASQRNFENLNDIYNYIRECKRNGNPLYLDNGTYGVSNEINGKKYIFTSPEARYESLIDPDRKEKTYKQPNDGKLIVRKHIPVGFADDYIINPLIGSKYAFQGYVLFDVYLRCGQEIIIEGVNEDEIKLADGYGNMIQKDGEARHKSYTLEWDGTRYWLKNTERKSIERNYYHFVVEHKADNNTVATITYPLTYMDNDMGYLHLDLSGLECTPIASLPDTVETTSLGFHFERGVLKCSKPSRLPKHFIGRISSRGLIKEDTNTYVWRYYLGNDGINSPLSDWLFGTDDGDKIVERKHKSYVFNRDTREPYYGRQVVNFEIIDKGRLALWRLNNNFIDVDYAKYLVNFVSFNGDKFDFQINNPFDNTTDDVVYYDAEDILPRFRLFTGKIGRVSIDYSDAPDDSYKYFTTIHYNRRKLKPFSKLRKTPNYQDKYIAAYRSEHNLDSFINESAVTFRVWQKYKGVKSQIPLMIVFKPTSPESLVWE